MERKLVNELSWSKSRASTLSDCPRQYFFHYYGYWGGWDQEADRRTREIYLLKRLKNRYLWVGNVTHDTIEELLQELRDGGGLPPLEEVLQQTRQRMRDAFRDSREGRFRSDPEAHALFEHEYQVPVPREDWRDKAEQVDQCLANFYRSPVLARIRELPREDWLDLEELRHFMLDGVKVHVKLDFSLRDSSGVALVDWKTGRSRHQDHTLQFGCYALYACQTWGIEPEAVLGLEVNLARGVTKEHHFTARRLKRVEEQIKASLDHMRELLRDPETNDALEEDFPRTEGPHTCGRCNYLKVCDSTWLRPPN